MTDVSNSMNTLSLEDDRQGESTETVSQEMEELSKSSPLAQVDLRGDAVDKEVLSAAENASSSEETEEQQHRSSEIRPDDVD